MRGEKILARPDASAWGEWRHGDAIRPMAISMHVGHVRYLRGAKELGGGGGRNF